MKKLALLLFVLLCSMPAHAQEIWANLPVHTENRFDPDRPMETWECSIVQLNAGVHMLDFLDIDGSMGDYVDCHGIIHGGGGTGIIGMTGDNTVYKTIVPVVSGYLVPQLQLQPPATFLAGPIIAVPGAAGILQSTADIQNVSPSNVTSAVLSFNDTQAGDSIEFAFGCINRGNTWNTASFADNNGDTFNLAAENGQAGQWIATNIHGGQTTVTGTFGYSGSNVCPLATYGAWESTNTTGVVDNSDANGIFFATGSYNLSLTTTFTNDLLLISSTNNDTVPPMFLSGTTNVTLDQQTGNSSEGFGQFGHAATSITGNYTVNIYSGGVQSYGFMVAYQTGGTFNPDAIWVDRAIVSTDLPAQIVAGATAPLVKDISIGDESGSALVDAQLGPQVMVMQVPANVTLLEVSVDADAGQPEVMLESNHQGSTVNIFSGVLQTAASGGVACANVTGTLSQDGITECNNSLQNIVLQRGDYIQLRFGTAGGVAKLFNIHIWYTINHL